MPASHTFRRQPVVRIRLIASRWAEIETAQAQLALTSGTLHWLQPRQGRRGEWLVYGGLILDDPESLPAAYDHEHQ